MKKFFILSILFVFPFCFKANATHLMGGDMTIKLDSGGSSYTLKVSLYRDINGIPLASTVQVTQYVYNTTSGNYDYQTMYSFAENVSLSTSLLPSFPYGVEVGIYTQTISSTSLSPGKYKFVYTECCRNNAIANTSTPGSESLVLYTDFEVFSSANNSSPECLTMPLAYFPINVPAYYNPLPSDADLDSLIWALNTPIGNTNSPTSSNPTFTNVVGFSTPPGDVSGPFTMNSYTGEITWTPNTLGNFVQSFVIDEYRGGVKIGSMVRDMQYVIVPDTSTDSIWCSAMTTTMYESSEQTHYIYYTPSKEVSFTINGNCLRASDLLLFNAYGSPFSMPAPATFTTSRVGTTITGVMKWTPPVGYTKDVIMVFRLKGGMFSTDYTLVLKKDIHPNNVNNITGEKPVVKIYPNPAHKNINISLSLAQSTNADISIYSVLGQKVQTVYNGQLPKGTHQLSDNLSLAPGMYFVVVKDNGTTVNTQHITIE